MSLSVVVGSSYQPFLLGPGDRLFRAAKRKAGFGSYLNKDKIVFVFGDNINFTSRAAVVSLQDMIAPLFEKAPGQFFTQPADISAFHGH